jgi:hypothetical protein
MFEVIISTITTGRVQRRRFDSWAKASRCADRYDEARTPRGQRVYRVELCRHEAPAAEPAPAPVAEPAAA